MNKYVQIAFSATEQDGSPPQNLFIRVLPIYAVPAYITDPVRRCPNHSSMSDATNVKFPEVC